MYRLCVCQRRLIKKLIDWLIVERKVSVCFSYFQINKCIGDDTKAAARQSLNCIKNKTKIKCGEKRCQMQFWHPAMWHDHDIDFARWLHPAMWHVALESWQWIHHCQHPAMWYVALDDMPLNSPGGSILQCDTYSSGIMTSNSPSGSTLQCGRWLWDNMPLTSPKRSPYWNSTSAFDFDDITAVNMSFCTSLRNFIQIGPPSAE